MCDPCPREEGGLRVCACLVYVLTLVCLSVSVSVNKKKVYVCDNVCSGTHKTPREPCFFFASLCVCVVCVYGGKESCVCTSVRVCKEGKKKKKTHTGSDKKMCRVCVCVYMCIRGVDT